MISESANRQQLASLEKKLGSAISSRADLEKDLSAQSSIFLKFINKLSLVCKGMDLELDNRLADFRQMHKSSQSFITLSNQINIISELLQQQAKKNDKNVRLMHNQLIDSSKQLQKTKGLPDQTRRDLRAFIASIDKEKETVIQYVPPLNDLLKLYDATVTAKNSITAESSQPEPDSSYVSPEFIEKLKNEVGDAISELSLSDKNQKDLLLAKKQVAMSKDHDDIINNIVNVFAVIAIDLKQERDTAKVFLSSLSQTLSNVQKAVASTLSSSEAVKKQNHILNTKLHEQLCSVTSEIEKANSLEVVKHDINIKLTAIISLLNDKQKFEDSAGELITTKLVDMTDRVKQLENESKNFQARLEEQLVKSMQDALTKLNNRAAFDEYFTKAMVKFHHKPYELSIVVIDLDNFKNINDTYGHTAGDKTLQVIANTLKKNVDKNVFLGRYGGEEFVLIFSNLDEEKLTTTLNNLRKKVALLPFTFKNNKVSITTSIGCTHIKAGDNIHQAFERADEALYQAKEQGKNQVVYRD
ncbi:MAG: GGDEF domain-containing protein [Thalassotalea sp.]